ncbi:MAG: amidohydrolase [Eubacteriaceae bacterium]|nr:amidohydrolase [Eubacteriaceae bacterium]
MEYADMILKSDAIFDACSDKPFEGGVAVKDNKIIDVCRGKEIDKYKSENTIEYDFQDKLIMPGLVDGHVHMWWGAVAESDHMVDLTSSSSEEEAIDMIKEYAASHPDEKRIRGFGWFPANWNGEPLPTKISLDEAVPDRPAYMNCADAHTSWLNTKALEETGYSTTMKLKGGYVGTFENGEMNGLIHEPDAQVIAWNKMYDFPDNEIEEIMTGFMKGLAEQGVTALSEMSADEYEEMFHSRYRVINKMAERGEITSRIHIYTALMGHTDFSAATKLAKEFSSDKFRVSGLKGFLDGVTSTYTGLLFEPYTDRPDTCGVGVPLATQEELNASVAAGNAAGLPVRIHALGDKAVSMVLDAYEYSRSVNGEHGLINSIEHIETIQPDDIARFKELSVIASMQGEHLPLEHNEKIVRLGKERCRWEWAFRSFEDEGVTLAFGTDFPVVYYNQFPGIGAAVTRKNYDGTMAGVDNKENLTLSEALIANTMGSAKVYKRENEIGSLEQGKLADIIVLDRNPFNVPADDIKNTKVILTVMDGNVTYERDGR